MPDLDLTDLIVQSGRNARSQKYVTIPLSSGGLFGAPHFPHAYASHVALFFSLNSALILQRIDALNIVLKKSRMRGIVGLMLSILLALTVMMSWAMIVGLAVVFDNEANAKRSRQLCAENCSETGDENTWFIVVGVVTLCILSFVTITLMYIAAVKLVLRSRQKRLESDIVAEISKFETSSGILWRLRRQKVSRLENPMFGSWFLCTNSNTCMCIDIEET